MYYLFSLIWAIALAFYVLFALSNLVLPLAYSLPLSIKYAAQKKAKPPIVMKVLIAPVVWLLMTVGLFFVIVFLAEYTQSEMFASVVFGGASTMGLLFGSAIFFFGMLRKDARNDVKDEYYKNTYINSLTEQQSAWYEEFERDAKNAHSDALNEAFARPEFDYIEKFIIFRELAERHSSDGFVFEEDAQPCDEPSVLNEPLKKRNLVPSGTEPKMTNVMPREALLIAIAVLVCNFTTKALLVIADKLLSMETLSAFLSDHLIIMSTFLFLSYLVAFGGGYLLGMLSLFFFSTKKHSFYAFNIIFSLGLILVLGSHIAQDVSGSAIAVASGLLWSIQATRHIYKMPTEEFESELIMKVKQKPLRLRVSAVVAFTVIPLVIVAVAGCPLVSDAWNYHPEEEEQLVGFALLEENAEALAVFYGYENFGDLVAWVEDDSGARLSNKTTMEQYSYIAVTYLGAEPYVSVYASPANAPLSEAVPFSQYQERVAYETIERDVVPELTEIAREAEYSYDFDADIAELKRQGFKDSDWGVMALKRAIQIQESRAE